MSPITGVSQLTVGDRVLLCGDHPWKGSKGRVVAIKLFLGRATAVVRLEGRGDAMDGHEVGVTSDRQWSYA